MTPSQRSPSSRARPRTASRPASDSAIERLTFLRLWVSEADEEDVDLLEALAGAQRVVQAALVGDQDGDRDVVGHSDPRQHLVGVGELRDDVGAHEARRLDPLHAGARERVDQAHLVVGRDDLGLVLEAVARADLADADGLGKVWHRTLNIYSPPLSEPIAIIGATGALGFGLTLRWGRAGVPVVLGSRDASRAAEARRARPRRAARRPLRGLRERRGGGQGRRRRCSACRSAASPRR